MGEVYARIHKAAGERLKREMMAMPLFAWPKKTAGPKKRARRKK